MLICSQADPEAEPQAYTVNLPLVLLQRDVWLFFQVTVLWERGNNETLRRFIRYWLWNDTTSYGLEILLRSISQRKGFLDSTINEIFDSGSFYSRSAVSLNPSYAIPSFRIHNWDRLDYIGNWQNPHTASLMHGMTQGLLQ